MFTDLTKLIAYDTSAIVNVGGKITSSSGGRAPQSIWNTWGIPTGGIFLFLRQLSHDMKYFIGDSQTIVPAFENKVSWRKMAYPDYKSNRGLYFVQDQTLTRKDLYEKYTVNELNELFNYTERQDIALKEAVGLQLQILYEMLKDVGFNALSVEGCEADDILYMLSIYSYAQNPEMNLTIKVDDHDLADADQFNPKVFLEGIKRNSTIRTVEKGQLFKKIYEGCNSDKISSIHVTRNIETALNAFADNTINPFSLKIGNVVNTEPLERLGLTQEEISTLIKNVYLVLPFLVELPEIKPTKVSDIDYDKLHWWLSVLGQNMASKQMLRKGLDVNREGVKEKREEIVAKVSPFLKDYLITENKKYC